MYGHLNKLCLWQTQVICDFDCCNRYVLTNDFWCSGQLIIKWFCGILLLLKLCNSMLQPPLFLINFLLHLFSMQRAFLRKWVCCEKFYNKFVSSSKVFICIWTNSMKRKSDTFFDDHNFFEKVTSDGRQLETRKSFQRVFHFFLFLDEWARLDAILLLSLENN
jgi:hypothetical protein